MNDAEKRTFISEDLHYELRCLLGDATVWRAFQAQNAGFDVVVAMDAAFLHARNLFNFLAQSSRHDICVIEFGPLAPYASPIYKAWKEALHQHVLHIRDGRLLPNNVIGGQHLNQQVETFFREALRLWELFENDTEAARFQKVLREARVAALRDAGNDAAGRITALF